MKMNNNCAKLTYDNQIVYWGWNTTELLFDVQPNMWPPVITYSEHWIEKENISVLHYEWCRRLMLIIKEFAKSVKAK